MDGYVLVVHRNKVQTAVFAINMGNQFADHPLELGRVRQSWAGDLDHDDIPNPFGVILKELLEGAELILKLRSVEIKIKAKRSTF